MPVLLNIIFISTINCGHDNYSLSIDFYAAGCGTARIEAGGAVAGSRSAGTWAWWRAKPAQNRLPTETARNQTQRSTHTRHNARW